MRNYIAFSAGFALATWTTNGGGSSQNHIAGDDEEELQEQYLKFQSDTSTANDAQDYTFTLTAVTPYYMKLKKRLLIDLLQSDPLFEFAEAFRGGQPPFLPPDWDKIFVGKSPRRRGRHF